MKKERNRNIAIASIIILAVLSRLVPHPPNFAPITGISLFSSKKINNKLFGVFLPIIPLFISDLFIGISFINIFVYLSFIIIYFLGSISPKIDVKTVFLSSVIFFYFNQSRSLVFRLPKKYWRINYMFHPSCTLFCKYHFRWLILLFHSF